MVSLKKVKAFTLIELLVVVAIIGILATLEWKTLFQQLLKLEERIVVLLILTLQKNNKKELVRKYVVILDGEQERMTMKLQSSVILFRINNKSLKDT